MPSFFTSQKSCFTTTRVVTLFWITSPCERLCWKLWNLTTGKIKVHICAYDHNLYIIPGASYYKLLLLTTHEIKFLFLLSWCQKNNKIALIYDFFLPNPQLHPPSPPPPPFQMDSGCVTGIPVGLNSRFSLTKYTKMLLEIQLQKYKIYVTEAVRLLFCLRAFQFFFFICFSFLCVSCL